MSSFDLGLSEDERLVADSFRAFFVKECPPAIVRAAEPLGFSASLWQSLTEIDAPGMGVAASLGGGDATLGQLVVALIEAGAHVAPVPLVEHLVGSRALGTHVTDDVVSGSSIVAFAPRPASPAGRWDLVPAGAISDVVVGWSDGRLVAVRSGPPGSSPPNMACAPIADRSATTATCTVLGHDVAWRRARAEWDTLTAAVLVGVAAQALVMGVDYVKTRHQFGVPIGSFQSVQHGLAGVVPLIEGARLLVHKAAWALDEPTSGVVDVADNEITDGPTLAAMAFVAATEAAATSTDRSLHYHGGYGYSTEYDIQLYYRRARGWALAGGSISSRVRDLSDVLFPVGAPS